MPPDLFKQQVPHGDIFATNGSSSLKAADLLLLCPLAQDFLSERIGEVREWLSPSSSSN